MVKTLSPGIKADYLGITGSVLCIVHCVATPFLLLTVTWLRNDTLRSGFLSLDYVFVAINALAVFSATRHATTPAIKIVLWGSLTLFAGCLLLEEVSPLFGYGTYLASAGLIGGHIVSIRYCQTHHNHAKKLVSQ